MQVVKLGNYLADRLPAKLVLELGLKEGDEIDLVKDESAVTRHAHMLSRRAVGDFVSSVGRGAGGR